MKRLFFYMFIVPVIAGISGYLYQFIATQRDKQKGKCKGRMIEIGGYQLHMIDSSDEISQFYNHNKNKLTIVMEAGAGCSSTDWGAIQEEIAKFARVITYDRAGYGWSDESPLPRTAENIVEELHTMLKHAGAQGPYILVGHSFGGLIMQLFASKYSNEAAGVILVDSVHENAMNVIPQIFINFKRWTFARLVWSYVGIMRLIYDCTCIFRPQTEACTDTDAALKITPTYYSTLFKELDSMKISSDQVKASAQSLGSIPLIVLTSRKQVIPEKGPCGSYSRQQATEIHQHWLAMQADFLNKSSDSKQVIAEQSGHNIPGDQPQIIVQAVFDMLNNNS